MTIPSLIFGFLLSSLYGAVFHMLRGGRAGRFLLYLILSWAGFWAGHFLAEYLGMDFDRLGQMHIGFATLGSVLFLALGYWLSLVEVEKK